MFMPTFEETRFICKDCGHMFQGRDCKEWRLGEITGGQPLLPPFGSVAPSAPGTAAELVYPIPTLWQHASPMRVQNVQQLIWKC